MFSYITINSNKLKNKKIKKLHDDNSGNKKSYAMRSLVLSKPNYAHFMSNGEFFHINLTDINKPL